MKFIHAHINMFFLCVCSLAVAPLNIRLLGAHQHQPLSAGRRYDLLCQSAGSRPPAIITWCVFFHAYDIFFIMLMLT